MSTLKVNTIQTNTGSGVDIDSPLDSINVTNSATIGGNLQVNNILPSIGTNVAIGTAGGSVTLTGTVSGSSNINVGTGASISSPATNVLALGTNNSERVRIDSSGNFNLVNTAGIMTAFKYETPALINNHFKSNSTSAGAYVRMYASAGTGQWDIYNNGANLRFSDNASAGNIQMDRPLVMNSQNIVMSSGNGIDFSATANSSGTMTSELLSDYEEGSWTPNVLAGASSLIAGWFAGYGPYFYYIKIGKQVTIFLSGVFNGKTAATGNVTITGVPFSCPFQVGYTMAKTRNSTNKIIAAVLNGTTITLYQQESGFSGTGSYPANITNADFYDYNGLDISLTYYTS